MVLGALSMGFSMDDLYWMSLSEFLIFSAITAEAYEGREDDGYRDATQEDIEAMKRM